MNNYRKLAYGGLIGALVFLGTYLIQIPIPGGLGYANFGDGVILISSTLLGPFAAVPAAIGSALADMFAGFPQYIPFTFTIKGLVALVPSLLLRKKTRSFRSMLLPFILAEAVMVSGYFIADSILYGTLYAAGAVGYNLLQGFVGVVLGIVGSVFVLKNNISIK